MALSEQMYEDLKGQFPAIQDAMKQGLSWGTEIAHDLITYIIIVCSIETVVSLCVIIGIAYWGRLVYKNTRTEKDEDGWNRTKWSSDVWIAFGIVSVCIGIPAIIMFGVSMEMLLKAIFIPELAIIQYSAMTLY
jgi:hypothetical protein